MIAVHRRTRLPEGLMALTATARGMEGRNMSRAAREAFSELCSVVGDTDCMAQVRSCLSICPDSPSGPDDPDCRYLAGFVFGYAMADGQGVPTQPVVPLSGSLAWWPLAAGDYLVFLHQGPYQQLHQTWAAIFREGLPATGATQRNAPPLELMLNDPESTPDAELLTEIWIPVTPP